MPRSLIKGLGHLRFELKGISCPKSMKCLIWIQEGFTAPIQDTLGGFKKALPLTTHTHLIQGVEVTPPKSRGWGQKNTTKQGALCNPTPLIKGVNLHPP